MERDEEPRGVTGSRDAAARPGQQSVERRDAGRQTSGPRDTGVRDAAQRSPGRRQAGRNGGWWLRRAAGVLAVAVLAALGGLYAYAGAYGINVVLRRGGTWWITVAPDDARLTPSMRLALQAVVPEVRPGPLRWQTAMPGFEVAELPVLAEGAEVDRLLLARIDPRRFRFEVHSAPAGNKGLERWMDDLGASLVINGSYYSGRGEPDTPLLSDGQLLGPAEYDARHGAFVAADSGTGVRDLRETPWQQVFKGAHDALVSYPLLVSPDGVERRVTANPRWLANRSFVAEDREGWIVLGTTREAFFSLDRFAGFLRAAPLNLRIALNLDGGGVACQGIAAEEFRRRFCGLWETATVGDRLTLQRWGFGTWALPVVLAVRVR